MNRQFYEKVFSTQRMLKYFRLHPESEEKAITHYHANIELSESFYPILSVFEVALRNSLNRELIEYFGTTEWYLKMESTLGLRSLKNDINLAKKQILNRNELINPDKMIAELTLGFWVRMLNAEYEKVLWKPLRRAFPYIEKSERQRRNVSAPINKIRNFRNRIFHHEPISWKLEELTKMHNDILMVMGWLNKDLPTIAQKNNTVLTTIEKVNMQLYVGANGI